MDSPNVAATNLVRRDVRLLTEPRSSFLAYKRSPAGRCHERASAGGDFGTGQLHHPRIADWQGAVRCLALLDAVETAVLMQLPGT